MALDAGGPSITTLEELLPLLEGVTKVKEFGWIIIQHVPTKPVTLKRQLALAARDHFGHKWTDKTLSQWLAPGCHTEKRAEVNKAANAAWLAIPENKERHQAANAAWLAIPENKERKLAAMAAWHKANPRDRTEYNASFYAVPENKERQREYRAAWNGANPDYKVEYQRNRRANDPAFKILGNLRSRLYCAVKTGGAGKSASTMELTGCTLPELMAHLEAQFTEGMTWANQGDWHIDHIKPCASFDMMDPEQQRQCFHYTNLQPLWGADNMSKGDKLNWSPNAQIEPRVEPTASNS